MKRSVSLLALCAATLLSACGAPDAPQEMPSNVTVKAGDTVAYVSWTAQENRQYWVFRAEGTTLDYDNREKQPGYRSQMFNAPPAAMEKLTNGIAYAFMVAAADGGSPVGPHSESVTVTPRPAGAEWSTGVALPGTMKAVAFSSELNLFAAVGAGGAIYTSADAITWTPQVSGTSANLNGIVFSNSRFVVVGDGGNVLRSTDGQSWNLATAQTTANLNAVTVYGENAIAVGDSGVILVGNDGFNWTTVNSGTTQALYGVGANTNLGRVVAVGANGTAISTDDSFNNWQPLATGVSSTLRAAASGTNAAGLNMFSVVGDAGTALWSNDGVNFTATATPAAANLKGVAYGSQFAAIGDAGTVFTSMDAQTWIAQNSGSTAPLHGIAFGFHRFSAVGDAGVNLSAL